MQDTHTHVRDDILDLPFCPDRQYWFREGKTKPTPRKASNENSESRSPCPPLSKIRFQIVSLGPARTSGLESDTSGPDIDVDERPQGPGRKMLA